MTDDRGVHVRGVQFAFREFGGDHHDVARRGEDDRFLKEHAENAVAHFKKPTSSATALAIGKTSS